MKPQQVVVFRTGEDGQHRVAGVIASTPTTTLRDGTPAVFVQPRPLILLAPTSTHHTHKSGTPLVTGALIDTTEPCIASLMTMPIPAPAAAAPASQPPPLSADDVATVMTDEELREMREHREGLAADLTSSRARVHEIDELLHRNVQLKGGSSAAGPTASPLRASSPPKTRTAAAQKMADEAAKASEAAEKELMLARASLRTVKPLVWIDLQRRRSGSSSQTLVSLVEAAAVPLHDRACAAFDDIVPQVTSLPKRLAAVKSAAVTTEDTKAMSRFLMAWPVAAAVEKEHKSAAAVYRWVSSIVKAALNHRRLLAAQQVRAAAAQSPESTRPSTATSADAAGPSSRKLGAVAEAALRKERKDQLEYVQMAEEELAAIDALIAEASTLNKSPRPITAPDAGAGSRSVATVAPALVVPAAEVLCTLTAEEEGANRLQACAHRARGTPVEFSARASLKLAAVAPPASPLSAATSVLAPYGLQVPGLNLASVRKDSPHQSAPRRSPRGSPRHSGAATSLPAAASDAAVLTAAKQHAEAMEKARVLEARLAAALQQNPRVAEVQLLRDELEAKRSELHRVTEERDRLLHERRERSHRYTTSARRTTPEAGAGDGVSQPGSGRYARQPSTPRETVDRSIVEELEEQLTAAHKRISELLIEASEARHRSPVRVAVPVSARAARRRGSEGSPRTLPSGDESESANLSACETPLQQSPRGSAVSPHRLSAFNRAPAVTQDVHDDLLARLNAVSSELEAQRGGAHRLEEQLNDALHRRTEADKVVASQQRELQEVWERLEAAEARAEEQGLLAQQRLFMSQTQTFPSPSPPQPPQQQPAAPAAAPTRHSSSSTLTQSQTQAQLQCPPLAPRLIAHPALNVHDVLGSSSSAAGGALGAAELETKSQANDDAATEVTNANTAFGNASRLSAEGYPHLPAAGGGLATFGGSTAAAPAPLLGVIDRPSASPYSRGPSILQTRPVEQLSTIELRHEVHRLREEVERHQSGELRMTMELQTLREKHKAERKRRRDARVARMQMVARIQGNIADVIEKSTNELEEIPPLLERSREEADALTRKRLLGR